MAGPSIKMIEEDLVLCQDVVLNSHVDFLGRWACHNDTGIEIITEVMVYKKVYAAINIP